MLPSSDTQDTCRLSFHIPLTSRADRRNWGTSSRAQNTSLCRAVRDAVFEQFAGRRVEQAIDPKRELYVGGFLLTE
jgi:hypothetical protein